MADWCAPARVVASAGSGTRQVGIDSEGRPIDHAEFRRLVAAWRQAFAADPGRRRWALYFGDTLGFAAALYGAWHAGVEVVLPGDTLPETLARLRQDVDGFAGDLPATLSPLRPAGAAIDAVESWPALDEDTTRLTLYTSGSRGEPTAIGKRLRQLAREVEALEASFGAALDGAVVHGTVSHQHIYGLLFRVLWPLAAGRPIAVRRLLYGEDMTTRLGPEPSVLVTTPAHLRRLPETLDWRAARSSLRAIFSSGGPLSEDAAEATRRLLGRAPIEIYGSSETGGVAWRRREGGAIAWRPLPGVRWRLQEERLLVASPHLADEGWHPTEDRAVAADNDSFVLLGRADRIVKLEERRVSLDAVERRLLASHWLDDARVLVLTGQQARLGAVLVPNAAGRERLAVGGRRALAQALRAELAGQVEPVAIPRRWRVVTALPTDAQGKVALHHLQPLFRPERPVPVWRERLTTSAVIDLEIEPELRVFDGHFPETPVLPGIAQLDWAVRWGAEVFGFAPHSRRIEALKFQALVRPGMRLSLRLDWNPERRVLGFRYESEAGAHASGRVVIADAGETA